MAINIDPNTQYWLDIDCIHSQCPHGFGDRLSARLWRQFTNNFLNRLYLEKRVEHKYRLFECLFDNFGNIFFIGSTANGFGTNDSDLELTLFVTKELFDSGLAKQEKMQILAEVENQLLAKKMDRRRSEVYEVIEPRGVGSYRVPVLRYTDPQSGLKVKISVNNDIGVRTARLLYCYSKRKTRRL